jgi:hypothetical protein
MKSSKKLASIVMASAMAMTMVVGSAFGASADNLTGLSATLYKSGTTTASMGAGAIKSADVNTSTGEITVYLKEDFSAYGATGNLSNVYIDLNANGSIDETEKANVLKDKDNNGTFDAIVFTYPVSQLQGDDVNIVASFTMEIRIGSSSKTMPINALGDIHIDLE